MTPQPLPPLPPEGCRISFVGKGGSGKSTTAGHVIAHWTAAGVPVTGFDADDPGEDEKGSLSIWAGRVRGGLGAPIYPVPDPAHIAREARRLTPPHGIGLLDSGAWENRVGNRHYAVLAAADLVALFLAPTPMETERGSSVRKAMAKMEAMGLTPPQLVIVLSMVHPTAAAAAETRQELVDSGLTVLTSEVPLSHGREGYAQSFNYSPRAIAGSPMDKLARELHAKVAAL